MSRGHYWSLNHVSVKGGLLDTYTFHRKKSALKALRLIAAHYRTNTMHIVRGSAERGYTIDGHETWSIRKEMV